MGPNVTSHPAAATWNRMFQTLLKKTKWRHYKLIGWQFDANDPELLANTQMEMYFQRSSSCITCHSLANIGPPEHRRLAMWERGRQGIHGYTGDIDFQELVKKQFPHLKFKEMDYVWSLRQAKKFRPIHRNQEN